MPQAIKIIIFLHKTFIRVRYVYVDEYGELYYTMKRLDTRSSYCAQNFEEVGI